MFPTPTPYSPPAGTPVIQINVDDFGLWEYAPQALNVWNTVGSERTQMLQIAIIIILIVATVVLLPRLIKWSIMQENSEGKD